MTVTPARWPARRALPRIGVSARRLRKPFWMSRARSVPAFIVANSAPWMNGTATAKARNESVGKPVERGRRPEAGRVDGDEHRRKEQRREDVGRLAQRADDAAPREARDLRAVHEAMLSGCSAPAPSSVRPVFGEEHVVEARRVELQMLDVNVGCVESPNDVGQAVLVAGQAHGRATSATPASARRTARGPAPAAAAARDRRGSPPPSGARSRPSARRACPRRRCARGR